MCGSTKKKKAQKCEKCVKKEQKDTKNMLKLIFADEQLNIKLIVNLLMKRYKSINFNFQIIRFVARSYYYKGDK